MQQSCFGIDVPHSRFRDDVERVERVTATRRASAIADALLGVAETRGEIGREAGKSYTGQRQQQGALPAARCSELAVGRER